MKVEGPAKLFPADVSKTCLLVVFTVALSLKILAPSLKFKLTEQRDNTAAVKKLRNTDSSLILTKEQDIRCSRQTVD